MRSRITLLAVLTLLAGCAGNDPTAPCRPNCYVDCLDQTVVAVRARSRARRALNRCRKDTSCHFREGFTQAYVDIAQGGNGVPPGVPPERYWGADFRTPDGHARAQEWYDGYLAGVESASHNGRTPYNSIPTSLSIGQGLGPCNSSPFEPYGPELSGPEPYGPEPYGPEPGW